MKKLTLSLLIAAAFAAPALAQAEGKIKIGLMLPETGTFAALGQAVENGFKLYVSEQGGRLGGREIEYIKIDDESDPTKATGNVNRLIQLDNVDLLVGSVHSGVAIAMAQVARQTGTLLIVPNAGADAVTGSLCAKNIFRSSFSNWQPGYAMGEAMARKGHQKAVTVTWKYPAGEESVKGFKDAFEKSGGKVVRELSLPFPNIDFKPLLAEIAAAQPDAVYTFFAGGGAVKFVWDYDDSGLRKTIPLYGAGFLTDGTLDALGPAAAGLLTTLHYGDGIDKPRNRSFRAAYEQAYQQQPDVYAVQGYDAAQMLAVGAGAVKGDLSRKDEFIAAVERARFDSPRGAFAMSRSHNPVQDIYLRQVKGRDNQVIGVASRALADPGTGCRL